MSTALALQCFQYSSFNFFRNDFPVPRLAYSKSMKYPLLKNFDFTTTRSQQLAHRHSHRTPKSNLLLLFSHADSDLFEGSLLDLFLSSGFELMHNDIQLVQFCVRFADSDAGPDMSRWSEKRVKKYLSDFASRKSVTLNPRKAWQGTGADLIGEPVTSLSLLFVEKEPRVVLELFYEIHPSEVLSLRLSILLYFGIFDMSTGLS